MPTICYQTASINGLVTKFNSGQQTHPTEMNTNRIFTILRMYLANREPKVSKQSPNSIKVKGHLGAVPLTLMIS